MKKTFSLLWIPMWIIVFIVGINTDCVELLSNKGIHLIGNEYYRFFTGLLLHVNLFHLAVNVISVYCIGSFLIGQISAVKTVVFSAIVGVCESILFSVVYPDSISIGGSPIVFSLIGLMCVLQLLRKDLPRFRMGTWRSNWIVGYAILGNMPVFSGNSSTLICHLLAMTVALILGYIGLKLKLL